VLHFKAYTVITEATKEKLDTSKDEPVVIAPGRFNPPHRGHQLMIKELIALSQQLKAKPVIIVVDSGKRDERNPLSGPDRAAALEKMFPMIDIHISKNPYEAVFDLHDKHGEVPIGGVTGADRADSYKGMIGRIFGPEEQERYEAKILHRDPDAVDDVAGVSGTKTREAAVNGDEGAFRAMTGLKHEDAIRLMAQVRKGMGVE
jgi:nicotinamide mononucleotide adenylyltransferase